MSPVSAPRSPACYLGFLPGYSLAIVAIFASALFGAAFAAIPGYLQAKRDSHIVITTIMFNYIASAMMGYILVQVMREPGQMNAETHVFPPGGWVPQIHEILKGFGVKWPVTPLNLSFFLALAAALGVWVLIWRTRLGYEIRTVGANPTAAIYGGISPARITMITTLMSGALAGGLAVNVIIGEEHRLILEYVAGFGFVGIAVALMGRAHPAGIVLAAILFGVLYQGGAELAFDKPKISRDMIVVIQGLVVLFAGALEHMFRRPLAALLAKLTPAPGDDAGQPSGRERHGDFRRLHRHLRLRHPPRRAADLRLSGGPVVGALRHRRHRARRQDADGRLRRGRGGDLHRQRLGRPPRGRVAAIGMSLIHGYASIDQRANQIVSGTAINMVADGMTALIGNALVGPGRPHAAAARTRRFVQSDRSALRQELRRRADRRADL